MKAVSDLAFFVTVARSSTLTQAAIALDVTPPAVSKRLALLEGRLGVKLMNRSTRRLSLTDEGEHYLAEGERLLFEQENLEQSLREGTETPRGLLRVNASMGFGRQHLARMMVEYANRHPQVELMLHLSDHPLDLIGEGFDLGVRFGALPDSRLMARKVAGNRRILCASPSYLARHGTPQSPEDLKTHDCLIIRQDNHAPGNWALASGGRESMVKVRGRLSSNNGEVAVRWAVNGFGVVLRSEFDVKTQLESGELVRVLPDWQGQPADIYAVYPHKLQLSAKIRTFVEMLVEVYGGDWPARQESNLKRSLRRAE